MYICSCLTLDNSGGDCIQWFYDVANVAPEPVRQTALHHVEDLAQRWKNEPVDVETVGANINQMLESIMGIYALERFFVSPTFINAHSTKTQQLYAHSIVYIYLSKYIRYPFILLLLHMLIVVDQMGDSELVFSTN
jgi:hypothetical protein